MLEVVPLALCDPFRLGAPGASQHCRGRIHIDLHALEIGISLQVQGHCFLKQMAFLILGPECCHAE